MARRAFKIEVQDGEQRREVWIKFDPKRRMFVYELGDKNVLANRDPDLLEHDVKRWFAMGSRRFFKPTVLVTRGWNLGPIALKAIGVACGSDVLGDTKPAICAAEFNLKEDVGLPWTVNPGGTSASLYGNSDLEIEDIPAELEVNLTPEHNIPNRDTMLRDTKRHRLVPLTEATREWLITLLALSQALNVDVWPPRNELLATIIEDRDTPFEEWTQKVMAQVMALIGVHQAFIGELNIILSRMWAALGREPSVEEVNTIRAMVPGLEPMGEGAYLAFLEALGHKAED